MEGVQNLERGMWHLGTEPGMCRAMWGLNMGSRGILLMDSINRDTECEEIRPGRQPAGSWR